MDKEKQGVVEQEVLQPEVTIDVTPVESIDDDNIDTIIEQVNNNVDQNDDFDKNKIIKKLLASKRCKLYKELNIKNIEFNKENNYFVITLDSKIIGNVNVNNVNVITLTNTFCVGGFGIRSTMFDNAKTSIFANDILDNVALATKLFNKGKLDVIAHYVKAQEPYVNPFSHNGKYTIFTEDRILFYVTKLTFGEVGEDCYNAYIGK